MLPGAGADHEGVHARSGSAARRGSPPHIWTDSVGALEHVLFLHMGVSINGNTPKWRVYKAKSSKMDDLGVPPIYGNTDILGIIIPTSQLTNILIRGVETTHQPPDE